MKTLGLRPGADASMPCEPVTGFGPGGLPGSFVGRLSRDREVVTERDAAYREVHRAQERPSRDEQRTCAHCPAPDGLLDCVADPVVGAAPAQIACHRLIDLLVSRTRMLLQQRRGRHQLPGLAEPALRHAELDPRLLQWMAAVRREPLDRDEFGIRGAAYRCHAGADHLPVEMHGAGPAERFAAAVLGAR